jgi:hypothetical protein
MPYLKVGEHSCLQLQRSRIIVHTAIDGAEGNGALMINIAFWPAFGRLPVQRDAGLRYEIWIGGRKVIDNFCRDRVKNISFQSWFSTQSPETTNVLIFGSSMSGGGLDGKAVLSELGPWILRMLLKVSRDWFQQPYRLRSKQTGFKLLGRIHR